MSDNRSLCDECGTELIENCMQCGAPVCCPCCCDEATEQAKGSDTMSRADWTRDIKLGVSIWIDGRKVARIIGSLDNSTITKDGPIPQWEKDVRRLVDAYNEKYEQAKEQHHAD